MSTPAEVTREEWTEIIGEHGYSIFVDPDFLEPIATAFGYSIKYFINNIKAKPAVGFACFVSGKRIVVPTHFIYSGIWYDVKPETIKFRNALIELLEFLKGRYESIRFRLPPYVKDIRPFQWNGFSHQLNYTYVRETADLNFEYNVRSRVKKARDLGILPGVADSFQAVWEHQQFDLKRFNFPSSLLDKLQPTFLTWYQKGYLKIYKAEMNAVVNGSSFVLVDSRGSKAYNLLISSANSNYQTGIHASLYNFIFEDLEAAGIRDFDLYGADIRGVSDFKASLGAKLESHYTVIYDRKIASVRAVKEFCKLKLLRLRARFF